MDLGTWHIWDQREDVLNEYDLEPFTSSISSF